MLGYHFVGDTLWDGSPVPSDGEWLEVVGPLKMCARGLHASEHPYDALQYAPGPILCRVELAGTILTDTDKVCAERRRIIRRLNATDIVWSFARACALDVVDLWAAPAIVVKYLQTGEERLRAAARAAAWNAVWDYACAGDWNPARAAAQSAARAAAQSAACAIARAAAWAAARAAAWAATWAAAHATARAAAQSAAWARQRKRFDDMVSEAFGEEKL